MVDLFKQRGIVPGAQQPQEQQQLGLLESFGQGAAQGATFGFSDELYGLGAGLIPGGQTREEATQAARARIARADPRAALAGELAGSLVLPGLGAARAGASLAGRAVRGATIGAGEGALGGIGRAEGDIGERAPQALTGGALGGVLGGAGAAAAPAAIEGVRRLVGQKQADTAAQQLLGTIARGDDIGVKGQNAVRGVQEAATKGRKGVNQAYEKVAQLEGSIEDQSAFALLSSKFNRILDDEVVDVIEGGDRIARLADTVVDSLGGGADIAKIEKARQRIAAAGRAAGSAKNFNEVRIIGGLQREFDDWMFDTLTNKLYRGDEQAIATLKKARGLSREYHRVFGIGGKSTPDRRAGTIINQIINDGAEAQEAVNLLFGLNGLGKSGARQALARIRDVSPDAFGELKGAHFMKMVTGIGGGDFLPAAKISSNIQKAMIGDQALMKTLYGDDLNNVVNFANNLKGRSVADAAAAFIRARPVIMSFVLGGGAAGAAGASGADPTQQTFAALLGAGFANLARRGGGAAGLAQLRQAAGPVSSVGAGRAANVGGVLGASENIGPSLGGN